MCYNTPGQVIHTICHVYEIATKCHIISEIYQTTENSLLTTDIFGGRSLTGFPQLRQNKIPPTFSDNLELSPSSHPNVYQPWHLPPSPQDPLFPAGLPTQLAPSYCASYSALADHCACLQIIFTYLVTYNITRQPDMYSELLSSSPSSIPTGEQKHVYLPTHISQKP